jgi:hypothetical protein
MALARNTKLNLPADIINRLKTAARRASFATGRDFTWTSYARHLLENALTAAEKGGAR